MANGAPGNILTWLRSILVGAPGPPAEAAEVSCLHIGNVHDITAQCSCFPFTVSLPNMPGFRYTGASVTASIVGFGK